MKELKIKKDHVYHSLLPKISLNSFEIPYVYSVGIHMGIAWKEWEDAESGVKEWLTSSIVIINGNDFMIIKKEKNDSTCGVRFALERSQVIIIIKWSNVQKWSCDLMINSRNPHPFVVFYLTLGNLIKYDPK